MGSYKLKFIDNLYENAVMSKMHDFYGDTLVDRCFFDISLNKNLVNFYLNYLYASLITVPCGDATIYNSFERTFSNEYNVDILNFMLEERIGIFENQYDVVIAFNTLNNIADNHLWLSIVENLLFYLKPNGLFFINGDFSKNTVDGETKYRSRGVWNTIVKKCNCCVDSIIKTPLSNLSGLNDILVIRK